MLVSVWELVAHMPPLWSEYIPKGLKWLGLLSLPFLAQNHILLQVLGWGQGYNTVWYCSPGRVFLALTIETKHLEMKNFQLGVFILLNTLIFCHSEPSFTGKSSFCTCAWCQAQQPPQKRATFYSTVPRTNVSGSLRALLHATL